MNKALYQNWLEEKRSVYLYEMMAAHEQHILHKNLFLKLKEAANKQAELWEQKIQQAHLPSPHFSVDLRMRLIALLIKWLGTARLHRLLAAMKIRGMSVFSNYHAEHKHTSLNATSNLRAAVFGIHDGLISNISLILGIAGANANQHFILLTGFAGLLAGACSMGAGEYISVQSQREIFEHQIDIEKKELETYPEEEMEELSLIYQARGIPVVEANKLAQLMIANPETALNTLAREELGINPEDLVSPISAMFASFFAFAIGASIPLLPFVCSHSKWNLGISILGTACALFVIGSLLSLFSNRHPVLLGFRMLAIGTLAGTITFIMGKLFIQY